MPNPLWLAREDLDLAAGQTLLADRSRAARPAVAASPGRPGGPGAGTAAEVRGSTVAAYPAGR